MPIKDCATNETFSPNPIAPLAKIIEKCAGDSPGKIGKKKLLAVFKLLDKPDLNSCTLVDRLWYPFIVDALSTFYSGRAVSPTPEEIAELFHDEGFQQCSREIKAYFKIETPTTVTTPLQASENRTDSEDRNQKNRTNRLSKSRFLPWTMTGIFVLVIVAALFSALCIWKLNDPDQQQLETETYSDNDLKTSTFTISKVTPSTIENLRRRKPGYSLSFQALDLSPRYIYETFYAMKDGVVDLTINCNAFFANKENCVDMSEYQNYDSIIEMTRLKNITYLWPNRCFVKSNMITILKFTEKLENARIEIGDDAITRKIIVRLNESSPGVNINSE